MTDNKKVDDLVALLDQFMTGGGGHMNVFVEENSANVSEQPEVTTRKSNECTPNMACSIPTLLQGMDEEEPSI